MTLREQFEDETGKVAHWQDPDGHDCYTQFSYEYTEWLEEKLSSINKQVENAKS